jgi:limonene-1,2-epoxide hydrolase
MSARAWDRLKEYVADDCVYVDMPVGPAFAARGPDDIVKRLQVGLADLAAYENHDGVLVADGDTVMYEHSETWTFTTGDVVELPFATVHRVRDGKVTLWKDYWDFGTVASSAPPDWLDNLGQAETSWQFDATGLV